MAAQTGEALAGQALAEGDVVLSGEALTQAAVAPFGQAHNYILARAGTGTPLR